MQTMRAKSVRESRDSRSMRSSTTTPPRPSLGALEKPCSAILSASSFFLARVTSPKTISENSSFE
jgi:hypothetical protein